MEIKNTRRYEAILVASAFVVYVVRRLFNVSEQLNVFVRNAFQRTVGQHVELHADASAYSDPTRFMFPIVGGAFLLLSAWLIFHLLVCPCLARSRVNSTVLLSAGLSLALIFASLFLFHWFMEYIRYSNDSYGHIIGLKTYSLFRKKTMLGDAIGVAVLFAFYELVSSACRYLQRQLAKEQEKAFVIFAYAALFIPAVVVFCTSLIINLPTPLWSNDTRTALQWLGSIVLVWALQEYIIRYVVPNLKAPMKVLLQYLMGFALLLLLGNALLWAAYSNFYFYYHPFNFLQWPFLKQLILTLSSAVGIAVFRRSFLKEQVVLQQQVAGTSAELAQLRSQINPHFLFNALNSLYAAAMKESAAKTADGIQRLGDMMRFMLQENNQERISVEKEIEYLHNYIHLQRIRIDETQGIEIKVILNQPHNDVYIAPMLLIPFVENAFKHGISHRSPSWIFITLSFDATHLYFRVQNARHIRKETDPEEYQSGIGLQNVEKRLGLLYPGRHTLQIQQSHQDYIAALTLSLW